MKALLLLAALAAVAVTANADPVLTPFLGANTISYNNSLPSDFELGGGGAISLSPHVSAVGSAWYGVSHSYFRGTVGGRVTATDADNQDFSVGLGMQYNASTEPSIRQEGWDADATVGWRPYPERWSAITLIAQGAYMLADPHAVYLMLGIRYSLEPF